jgi:hypothetical protein
MITCYLRYIIDPHKLKEFEHYGKLWIPLVEKFGGQHHGYFMPSEGFSNVALAMFTFPHWRFMRSTVTSRSLIPIVWLR